MIPEEKLFWAQVDGLNFERYTKVIEIFGSLAAARKNSSESKLVQGGIPLKSARSLMKKIQQVSKNWEEIQKKILKTKAEILFFEDENFPSQLTKIPDPPLFLFYKGDITCLQKNFLAVVGSRLASSDGKYAIENIVPEMVARGFVIVSGMAAGIDSLAHHQAIRSGGKTVAFWGTGIDMLYPAGNKNLADLIIQNGVVFSEFPLGSLPKPFHFPRRNRLVSGLSNGILVVEGKKKSGSLITADFALEQGKEVFAIPSSIRSPLSGGPHQLIQNGAKLTTCADDILEEFGISPESPIPKASYIPATPQEKIIYEALSFEAMSFDLLVQTTKISASELSSLLMMMSLQGAVEDIGKSCYVRR